LRAPGLTWFLPDHDEGFDNHNDYLCQLQNQDNKLSLTHLLSSRKAWTKGRAEPEGVKLFQIQIVLLILLITSGFGVVFRFDPRQEVQIEPSVAAGGFISSLAKPTMRFSRADEVSHLSKLLVEVINRHMG
jgi:hypothetical protein